MGEVNRFTPPQEAIEPAIPPNDPEPTDRGADNAPSDEPWLHEDDETVEALHRVAADLNRQVPIDEDRVRAHAEAIRTGAVEISQDEARMLAPRVMAVADREQAALRAEVERLRVSPDYLDEMLGIDPNDPINKLAAKVVELEATIARVEALADEIENSTQLGALGGMKTMYSGQNVAARLRTALRGPEPTEEPT